MPICRGSSGDNFVNIIEGCIEDIRSQGAQKRKWKDEVKDWFGIKSMET